MLKAEGVSLTRQPKVEVQLSLWEELFLLMSGAARFINAALILKMALRFTTRSILRRQWSLQIPGQSGMLNVGSIRRRQWSRLQDVRQKFSQPYPSR